MTNKELQELLKHYPDDHEILLENENSTLSSVYRIEELLLGNAEAAVYVSGISLARKAQVYDQS